MKNKNKTNILKQEKGSITVLVLASLLFFLIFLTNLYLSGGNKLSSQDKEIAKVQEAYDGSDEQMEIEYGKQTELKTKPVDPNVESKVPPTFPTKYGLIEVIWLKNDTNEVSTTPNAPDLYTNVAGATALTPVTWTKSADGKSWTEDTNAQSTWYNYQAGNEKEDNNSSMWANAKNTTSGGNSYFVWIPRYAYRITYYSDPEYTNITGYYDGWGMWNAIDGRLNYKLEDGIETVSQNGNKYIVHPAFMKDTEKTDSSGTALNDFDRGGWDKNLTGFWVSKYEMSRTGATDTNAGSGYETTFISVPNVKSARVITIGDMYTVARNYDTIKFSHMMKNSEWGAVAYLTHSQYGRNGHEIDNNNSSDFITGNGGGSTNAESASGTINAYNTTIGAKASTTGNVYGIYDLSGGAWEYVAAFNDTDTDGYESTNGSSFASTTKSSTKYETKYINSEKASFSTNRYLVGKTGDATKEVYKGDSSLTNWFGDSTHIIRDGNPFLERGGNHQSGDIDGIFSSMGFNGQASNIDGFRMVLAF